MQPDHLHCAISMSPEPHPYLDKQGSMHLHKALAAILEIMSQRRGALVDGDM